MSERWKPKHGEKYYFFDSTLNVKSELYEDDYSWGAGRITMGNYFKTEVEAKAAAEKVRALLLSLHDNKPLPKLTAEVFDRPDCPEWAKFAAVDADGTVWAYDNEPWVKKENRYWIGHTYRDEGDICIAKGFDASDWQNSLIERPTKDAFDEAIKKYAQQQANKIWQKAREHRLSEQYHNGPEEKYTLPDWCEVGEWIWHPEDMAGGRYLKITEIRGGGVYAKEKEDYDPDYLCFDLVRKYSKQARLRPYNAEEMKALLGKVVTEKEYDYYAYLVTAYTAKLDGKNLVAVAIDDAWIQADDVLRLYTINNKPCGVLEHLENGEWVE